MTKITKGVECYRFQDWDRKGTCAYSVVTVESWGKKQATVRKTSGDMAQERVYVEGWNAGQFVPVADCADPVAEAVRRGQEFAEVHRAQIRQQITQIPRMRADHGDKAADRYAAHLDAELAAIGDGRALNRDDEAATRAHYEATYGRK